MCATADLSVVLFSNVFIAGAVPSRAKPAKSSVYTQVLLRCTYIMYVEKVGTHYEIRDSDLEDFRMFAPFNVTTDIRRPGATTLEYLCCVLYAELFCLGLISNGVVLRTLITVLKYRIQQPHKTSNSSGPNNSILIYLVSLCVVNVLVLAAVPLTIADVGTGEWRLPSFFCSVYWLAESMNKIMTSMISASFSLSCYFSVCRFNVTQMYKSIFVAALILMGGLGVTIWQAYEAIRYADVFHLGFQEANNTFVIRGRKCLFHPSEVEETTKFTISTILCGYGIPALIMLLCYAAILKKVFDQSRAINRRMSSKFRRTVISVASVIMFYLCTWTPYWTLIITLSALNHDADGQKYVSQFAVFVHILPFLYSAFSPLVYIVLNRDVRNQYKAIQQQSSHIRKDTTTVLQNGFAVPLVRSEHVIAEYIPIMPCPRSV